MFSKLNPVTTYAWVIASAMMMSACTQVNITKLDESLFDSEGGTTSSTFADIVTIGKSKCGSCHLNGQNLGEFNFDPEDSIDPDDAATVLDGMKSSGIIDVNSAATSPFLTRPLNENDGDIHTSVFSDTSDADYQTILAWIQNGAPLDANSGGGGGGGSTAKAFAADVKPLVVSTCGTAGCHGGSSPQAGFDLTDSPNLYTNISAKVTAGDAVNSQLIIKITDSGSTHPIKYQTTDEIVTTISSWIDDGAQDN